MKDLSPDRSALEPIEFASRDEIQALQLDRMRWSLRHAYDNVPFYRNGFDAAGVHPDDLIDLAALSRFPFTVKNDLRDNYPFGMFAVPQADVRRIHGSSGTTGKPIVVGYTAADLDMWADVVARSIRAAGGRPGMKVHNAYGYGLFTGGLGLHAGAERLGCTVIPMSGGMTERQVRLIVDFEPEIIVVTPSYMLAIVDEMERQGVDPAATVAAGRHLRCRTVDRGHAPRDRTAAGHARGRHLRAVRGDRPGRGQRGGGDQGRTAHLGGPLLPRGDRPGHRRGAARGRAGGAGVHLVDQAGVPGDPLPHQGSHPTAARHGPHRCGGWRRSPGAPTT